MFKFVFAILILEIFKFEKSFASLYNNFTATVSPANDQLLIWGLQHTSVVELVTSSGSPVDDIQNSLTAGPNGPLLLQDFAFMDQIQAFDRERIPERVVHAKGAGAHGYFEVINDISSYSFAKVFAQIGSRTQVLVRFSRVAGEMGSADTTRDTRGFAIKFFTSEGVWDLVGNDSPVFLIRDAMRFPDMIHATRRNPQTHLMDPNAMWDFMSLVPETTFQLLIQFSDRGIPRSYRYMNGYSINTFVLVNSTGQQILTRFHWRTNQGVQNLGEAEALMLTATDPDYFIRDLYNAIGKGDYPSWGFYIQVMSYDEAENLTWNPLDPTKLWPESEFPLIQVGILYLNRNPRNYFAEVEMAAFSPSRLVPGIQPTPDKILQGRLFAYVDTQIYRLGPNYQLETANHPGGRSSYYNYQRDGSARCGDDEGDAVNYYPNSFHGPQQSPRGKLLPGYELEGLIGRYNTLEEDNFSQATEYWNYGLTPGERSRIVANLAASLGQAYPKIQKRALGNFAQVSPDLGQMLAAALSNVTLMTSR